MILPSNQKSSGGGHTILNGSGSAMTQRAGLQFEGMGVTDDSGNDKTVVTLPTPDYVDEQFNPSTTYSLGMTCIEGNVRYRYKNPTATSGHRPPDATYWEVLSVAEEMFKIVTYEYPLQSADATAGSHNKTISDFPYGDKSKYILVNYAFYYFANQAEYTGVTPQAIRSVFVAPTSLYWEWTFNANVGTTSNKFIFRFLKIS